QGAADTSPDTRIAEEEKIVRGVDRVIATSSAEVFELLRMGAHPRSVRIVPCGVDVSLFTPDGPYEERPSDRRRIVALSRLVPRKGIADVIEALVAIPGAELVVAGGGEGPDLLSDPEAQRLSALASRCGVGNRVSFRGRVEREAVPPLLRSADVVVCTPWYEPFGIVPLEAMACGVPVVVSSVGGLVDTVLDGTTGIHVPPRSPHRLAEALNGLLADEARRSLLGRLGAERARSRYSWSRIVADTLDVYRGLLRRETTAEEFALGT
ncbi:MAG: glycosyl transferase, group 1, partial [Candidatus Eremiobacteraeota bacterium]|nr:glycosyl transferase, group 1 [Candidatus Eremiobacteraeota bacterium]